MTNIVILNEVKNLIAMQRVCGEILHFVQNDMVLLAGRVTPVD